MGSTCVTDTKPSTKTSPYQKFIQEQQDREAQQLAKQNPIQYPQSLTVLDDIDLHILSFELSSQTENNLNRSKVRRQTDLSIRRCYSEIISSTPNSIPVPKGILRIKGDICIRCPLHIQKNKSVQFSTTPNRPSVSSYIRQRVSSRSLVLRTD